MSSDGIERGRTSLWEASISLLRVAKHQVINKHDLGCRKQAKISPV